MAAGEQHGLEEQVVADGALHLLQGRCKLGHRRHQAATAAALGPAMGPPACPGESATSTAAALLPPLLLVPVSFSIFFAMRIASRGCHRALPGLRGAQPPPTRSYSTPLTTLVVRFAPPPPPPPWWFWFWFWFWFGFWLWFWFWLFNWVWFYRTGTTPIIISPRPFLWFLTIK